MNIKKTVILFLILVAVGSYYFFFEATSGKGTTDKQKTSKAPELKKVFSFNTNDIVELRISRGKEKIYFERNDAGWRMVQPYVIQANATALDGFLEDFRDLVDVQTVRDHAVDLREFGLDKPSLTIEFKAKGSVPRILYLGNGSPTQTTIYAVTSDSPRVFLVGTLIKWDVDKEFEFLKNKTGPFFSSGH
jgi:hypothetical protein